MTSQRRIRRWRWGRSSGEFRWEDPPTPGKGGSGRGPAPTDATSAGRVPGGRARFGVRRCGLWKPRRRAGCVGCMQPWRRLGARPLTGPPPGLPFLLSLPLSSCGSTRREQLSPRCLESHARSARGGGAPARPAERAAERPAGEATEAAVTARWEPRRGSWDSKSSERDRRQGSSGLEQGWLGPCPTLYAEGKLRFPQCAADDGRQLSGTDRRQPPGGTQSTFCAPGKASPGETAKKRLIAHRRRPEEGAPLGGPWQTRRLRSPTKPRAGSLRRCSRRRRLAAPRPPPPCALREMEQRNPLCSLGYLPPLPLLLLLHALLLLLADGERGNFAAAGLGRVLAGTPRAHLPSREVERREGRAGVRLQ